MSILIIIIFGAVTLLTGLVIIINPEIIFGLLRKHTGRLELHIIAVVLRLALGALLIYVSEVSRFPPVIEGLGWLSIIAAISFVIIGRNNFIKLMSWALSLQTSFGRIGGFMAACIGCFLIYAFI